MQVRKLSNFLVDKLINEFYFQRSMPKLMQKTKNIDPDDILTEEDLKDIEQARKEFAAGKTIPLDRLMKELGLNVRRRAR